MTDGYIRKADAVNRMNHYGSIWMEYTEGMSKHEVAERALKASKQAVIDVLENLPPADVVKMRRGRWGKIGVWGRVYRCNQCGNFLDFDGVNAGRGDANFCPNCGARMDGGENG